MTKRRTAFFYGTLMHPKILTRVIANDGSHLQLCPAILLNFTRHRIEHADYPGIIPYTRSEKLFKRSLTQEEKSVQGILVTGLTTEDIACLDVFEGAEYFRQMIEVYSLGEFGDISAHAMNEDTSHLPNPLPDPTPAETYVFRDETDLEAQLWSYGDFVKYNAWKWYGIAADGNDDITEVDRRRENGLLSTYIDTKLALQHD